MEESTNIVPKYTIKDLIFSLVKRDLILVAVIMIMSVIAGEVYLKLKKPYYTATEQVFYSATVINDGGVESSSAVPNENAMTVFVFTVMDFCDTGVVLDRANSYYKDYLNSDLEIEDFIKSVRESSEYTVDVTAKKVFTPNNVKYSTTKEDSARRVFSISVESDDSDAVKDMLRVYALAYDIEATDYFGGVKTSIKELIANNSGIAVESNISTFKILLIAIVAGLVASALIIALKYMLNNTIANEDELERITGANLLAYIDDTLMGGIIDD